MDSIVPEVATEHTVASTVELLHRNVIGDLAVTTKGGDG